MKDEAYNHIFKSIIDIGQFDMSLLVQNLQIFADEELRQQAEELDIKITKEDVEQVYINILYDSFKTNDDKERFLRDSFDEENTDLMQILAKHLKEIDKVMLRAEITQFLLKNFGPDTYKNLKDAINGLNKNGFLSSDDRDLVRDLSIKDDKHLMAAWDCYTIMLDEEEFADTLQVLCDVKRSKKQPVQAAPEGGFGGFNFNLMGGNKGNSRQQIISNRSMDSESKSQEKEQPHLMRLFVGNQQVEGDRESSMQEVSQQNQSSDRDQPETNINLDDQQEGEEDPDYMEDIDGIMQYQHKILRKYAMLGMIKYSAVPFFHQLVTNRDYKMICIFEVFAQNRNEDDFLENLGIYSNQRNAGSDADAEEPEEFEQQQAN